MLSRFNVDLIKFCIALLVPGQETLTMISQKSNQRSSLQFFSRESRAAEKLTEILKE